MCVRVESIHVSDVHAHGMQHNAFAGPGHIGMHSHRSGHKEGVLELSAHF